MGDYKVVRAEVNDEQTLCDMFLSHISENTAYISHGEIQMGVGIGHFENGVLITAPSPKARECWMKYIIVYKSLGSRGLPEECMDFARRYTPDLYKIIKEEK